jgi:hypothetical protein
VKRRNAEEEGLMKRCVRIFLSMATVVLLLSLSLAPAGAYEFTRAKGIRLPTLSQEAFTAQFGNNPDIRTTDEEILTLARELYPPQGKKHLLGQAAKGENGCGEYQVGVLFASLQNPAISDATRAEVESIIVAAAPALPKTYTSGHFKISYTDNDIDPDNNVTLDAVKSLAKNLNSYWKTYSAKFKTPQNYLDGTTQMVDIKVYYMPNAYGSTNSSWNYINLDSKDCVNDVCNRKTTPAHELWHRVEYAYGFVSGTLNMGWIVEGTADWSQAYTNRNTRDYMKDMSTGLATPDLALIGGRNYDACHLWIYLEHRVTYAGIRDVWATYETNGKDAKAALDTVVTARLGIGFDKFIQEWSKANYIKDLGSAGVHSYAENKTTKTSCGVVYGPLAQVPRTSVDIDSTVDSTFPYTDAGTVSSYGADYYEFNLDTTDTKLTSLQVTVDGAGASSSFVDISGSAKKKITDGSSAKEVYLTTFKPGKLTRVGVLVGGGSAGANYTIEALACPTLDITGIWDDVYAYVYDLTLEGKTVLGTVDTGYCGVWNVRGSYTMSPSKLNFTATNPNYQDGDDGCTLWFKYQTSLASCDSIEGTWTNFHGFSGSFTMWKRDAAGAASAASRAGCAEGQGTTGPCVEGSQGITPTSVK